MLGHDDIKEKLPEYIRDGFMPEEVKAHLESCKECSEELSILQSLKEISVPDPGAMFFETLPQKIRMSLKPEKKKSIFARLVPAFAVIMLVAAISYIYRVMPIPTADEEIMFTDSLAYREYDISDLSEDDVPFISGVADEDRIYMSDEASYLREFAYLSSEEMESFYEGLRTENGGAL
ncbi:MAG: hypothetical protein AABZ36_00360 [Nitrospirota bacterium]